ncbi:MAG: hypothetical protein FK730_14180 [Asgard group archaeon]|nr:hypothetical protein [Asgard group archaeon]
MSKTKKILMLTNLLVISILISNVVTSEAAVRSWNPGDIFLWGSQTKTVTETYDQEENVGAYIETITRDEIEYNITAIDTVQKEYDAYRTTTGGVTFLNDRDYDAQEYIDDYLDELSDLITNVDYVWDYENNRSVLNGFGSSLDFYYLLEPDYPLINEAYIAILNGSEIVETLNDPYSSTIFNYTLNDVFDSIKIKIMGKGSLSSGLNQFLGDKSKWTFEFDLSDVIMTGVWNGTMNIYYPYQEWVESWVLEYNAGGVLQEYTYTYRIQLTVDDYYTAVFVEVKYSLGGMKAVAAPFSTLYAVAGLAVVSAIALIAKRKKK